MEVLRSPLLVPLISRRNRKQGHELGMQMKQEAWQVWDGGGPSPQNKLGSPLSLDPVRAFPFPEKSVLLGHHTDSFFSSFRSPLYHHLPPRPPQPKQILESTFHHITLFILLHMNLPHFLCIAYFLSCTLGFKLLNGKGCPFCSLLHLQCQKEGMASARYSITGTMDYTLEILTSPEKCHLHGTSA